ncbi:hypothetical protein CDAR_396641 [Caerostris darwini]|uniref:Uncharacterized protein n=1 Tax=Caerostris darwini TaxID=1538125 RepID=A0AAV4PQH5_9ARAC|nr:hypothetical protein CDAR_396641 [Caerostris darwini]
MAATLQQFPNRMFAIKSRPHIECGSLMNCALILFKANSDFFSPHPTNAHPLPGNGSLPTHFSAPLREAARYVNLPSLDMYGMAGKRNKNIAGIKAAAPEMAPGALTRYLAEYQSGWMWTLKGKTVTQWIFLGGFYLFLDVFPRIKV